MTKLFRKPQPEVEHRTRCILGRNAPDDRSREESQNQCFRIPRVALGQVPPVNIDTRRSPENVSSVPKGPLSTKLSVLVFFLAMAFSAWSQAQEKPFVPDASNSWEFRADNDVDAVSPIDLRALNEREAGEHGFIRLSEDGRGFLRGDGEPIRFWATHSTNINRMGDEDVRRYCRFLARMGVNLGLAGSALQPAPDQPDINKTHPGKLDETWRMVAAFKEQGIYSTLRGTWFHGSYAKVPGIDGYTTEDSMTGVIFFSPKLKEAYKSWMRDLLTAENPHTGIPLKDDPALAMITFFNEDSPLHFMFQSLKGAPLRNAQESFAAFAEQKYGSLEKAMDAWGGSTSDGDAIDEGRLGFLTWWLASAEGRKEMGNPQRFQDQLAFIAEVQRDYYTEMKRWLKDDLGCRQLVLTSNFRPAVPETMQDLENWVKAAGDVIGQNSYPGVLEHLGPKRGYMVQAGDFILSHSMTRHPLELAQVHRQVAGRPFMVGETLWPNPSEYTNESALLNAIFTNVADMAASSFAGPREIGYGSEQRGRGYYFGFGDEGNGFPIQKWNSSEPGHLAGYPAAALIARRGYGVQTRPAVLERRTFEEIISLEPPLLPEGTDYDPLYDEVEQPAGAGNTASDLPPEAFLMGPVMVEFTVGEAQIDPKVSAYDPANPVVESLDGSVRTDRKTGLVTLDTPSAKVAVGFLGAAGPVRLKDVIIESDNIHLAIAVIALDERPLSESEKILVQVTPRARPSGWQVEAATREDRKSKKTLNGWEIGNTGSLPFRMENITGQLTLGNRTINRAVALDSMGRPITGKTVELTRLDDRIHLTLPEDVLWILLEQKN